jgi:hypothetical protein
MRRKKQSDCDVILNDFEGVFGSIGNCINTAVDNRKSKMQVVGSLFGIGKSVVKLGWNVGGCAIKHTPKAIATVADAKRKMIDAGTKEYAKYQKQLKEQALEDKIRLISNRNK